MAEYTYKKIQDMRNALKEEYILSAGGMVTWSLDHDKLIEMRLQSAIAAGLLESHILTEVKIRPKDR